MAHAEKCPVCGGAGKVKVDGITIDCHGCENGKGWVTVKDEDSEQSTKKHKHMHLTQLVETDAGNAEFFCGPDGETISLRSSDPIEGEKSEADDE